MNPAPQRARVGRGRRSLDPLVISVQTRAPSEVSQFMDLKAAPSPCVICGAVEFTLSATGQTAPSGLPSTCRQCGSLEHERAARVVLNALPRHWLESSKCLRLAEDRAIPNGWFSELSDERPREQDVPRKRFDWVYGPHRLFDEGAERDATLEQLLGLVNEGTLLLSDGFLAARYEPAATDKRTPLRGARYASALREKLPRASILELVALDPSSLTLDCVFAVSLNSKRLVEMATLAAQRNIHARVFEASPGETRASTGNGQMTVGELPPAFDVEIYRELNADLRKLSPQEAQRHYLRHGIGEGRRSHALPNRNAFADLAARGEVLEIGPYRSPMLRGPQISYFDVLDSAGLRERAARHQRSSEGVPEKIHFVSPTGDLSIVDRKFDAVLSSHCIEHQPDLIRHLLAVGRLLRPGGRYFLLVPDYRYCFDHFLRPSTIADVLDAHYTQRRIHSLRSQVEHRALTTHNDAIRHWGGDHGSVEKVGARALQALRTYREDSDAYVDVHAWYFHPGSFEELIGILCELKHSTLRVERVYPTLENANEFWAVLESTS